MRLVLASGGVGNKPCPAPGCDVSSSGDCRPRLAVRWLAALGEVAVVLSRLLRAAACHPTDNRHVCPSRCWQWKDWGRVASESPNFIISEGFPCESWLIRTGAPRLRNTCGFSHAADRRTDRRTDRGLLPRGCRCKSLPSASHPAGDGTPEAVAVARLGRAAPWQSEDLGVGHVQETFGVGFGVFW